MKELHLNAYAKVNLALNVLGRREDGRGGEGVEVETVLHTVALHDAITLREEGEGIEVRVDAQEVPQDARHKVLRAATMLRESFGVERGVQIDIRKGIPVGAGLGGGSSDAATTLLGLVQMWKVRLDGRELLALSGKIGPDVPFFLEGGAAVARGRGDRLQWLPTLPTTWIVLAHPRAAVPKGWAESALQVSEVRARPDVSALAEAVRQEDLTRVGRLLGNVFEPLVTEAYPVVAELRARILAGEAYGASLTGAGPTVFGLMANEAAAKKVAEELSQVPGVEVRVTRTFAEQR